MEASKMRVVQVCARYYPYIGGVQTHVKEISERLVKNGFEVEIATTDPTGKLASEETINDVRIKRFKTWTPNEAYYFSEGLRKYLIRASRKYDIIHAHSYHALPALYAAHAKKTSLFVFTPHYIFRGQTVFRNMLHIPYKLIANRIFKRADKVICVSEYEKSRVMGSFRLKNDKICVIPNGVNLDELSKFRWNPISCRPRITYSGRLEQRQKNVDKLVHSLDLLTKKYNLNSELLIIGQGPYASKMVSLVKKLGLEDRVTWKPWLPRHQYLRELASSHMFVMPSEYECYCIAVVEALVMGVPTLVANSTALSEYIRNGVAFGISLPITPQSIAYAIDRTLHVSQRKEASNSLSNVLSWDNVVSRLIKEVYHVN